MTHDHRSRAGALLPSDNRSIPLDTKTARSLGGGARGRTLALIYRQLSYWSKYAKWTGSKGRKFFYKSQKELGEELGMSEKTINRGIKALRELGLIIVEKLHKKYWRQVNFYYLPQSPFAAAAAPEGSTTAVAPEPAPEAPPRPLQASLATSKTKATTSTNQPASTAAVDPSGAAAATAASIRSRRGAGFGKNVRIQQKKDNPFIKQTLRSVVERCMAMGDRMKNEQESVGVPISV